MKQAWKLPILEHFRVLFEVGSLSGLSDGELLARFVNREGDLAEAAFAALVERHGLAMMRICRSIVRNEHDAEDAFQATFLILATKANRLRVRDSLGPWLSAVAQRVARGARAVALARAARELRAAELGGVRESRSAGGADISSIVHEEIERLPERYRLPLLLCDIESYTHQEAARRLGWPLGTVKSRQARARARLRARLIRRGLSGALPVAGTLGSANAAITQSLIQSTARAAVCLLLREASVRAVSASVASLVTNSLRATVVTRLTCSIGVVLLFTAGVAASVLGQGPAEQKKAEADSVPPAATGRSQPAAAPAPVFEYEIRIWKDGAPVTPTMKLRAHPGDVSEVKIPGGTFELRFRPSGDSSKSDVGRRNRAKAAGTNAGNVDGEEQGLKLAQELLETELELIKTEADLKTLEDEPETESLLADKDRDEQIEDEFRKDPDVIELCEDIALADERRAQAKAWGRQANDPTRQMAEAKYKKLMDEYDKLWSVKYVQIGERLKYPAGSPEHAKAIGDLKKKIASLKDQRTKQTELLRKLRNNFQEQKTKK